MWNVFQPLPMAFGVIVMLVFGAVQMFLVDPFLAAIGMTVFPALFAVNLVFQRIMSPKVTRVQQLRAEVSEVAHESFEAALVVKSLGREDQEAERFTATTHELRDANIAVGRSRGVFDPAIEAIPTIGTLAVLAVGVWRVSTGHLTAAEVVQIAYLFSILAFPVRALGWVLAELPRAVVGADRVDGVLRATGSMDHGASRVPASGASRLDLDGVSYAYHVDLEDGGTERNPALTGVTLDVPAGGTTALVGPDRVRQVDPDQPHGAPRRPRHRRGPRRRHRPAPGAPGRHTRGRGPRGPADLHVRRHGARQRHARGRAHRRRGVERPARRPGRGVRAAGSGRASTRGWASGAPASRAGSGSASRWPGR